MPLTQHKLETGLYYYRARYYDSFAGRFLTEDSVRFRADINFYRYVYNNPINNFDPSGNWPIFGWWCGPNWTGGRSEMYDPGHEARYRKPVNRADAVCMKHDKCYYGCRKNFRCDMSGRTQCMSFCDSELEVNMPDNWYSILIAAGIFYGNRPPDTGESPSDCSCNKDKDMVVPNMVPPKFDLNVVMQQMARNH
jgi:RHS repeat-associated protein